MPELPEVETVRRGLQGALGRRVVRVRLHRADICTTEDRRPPTPVDLLQGRTVAAVDRRGKQLVLVSDDDRRLVIHLGMSGQVLLLPNGEQPKRTTHIHAEWDLDDGSRVVFRDPRRFGGLWTLSSEAALAERWRALGPDALDVRTAQLRKRAGRSLRAIKAVLLDQAVLAGVGNIYADEALFRAGISPRRRAARLTPGDWGRLAAAIRQTLRLAIRGKGSSLRDYVGAGGEAGEAQTRHQVYGRGRQPCLRCGSQLRLIRLAQRATVYCPHCQH